MADEDGQPWLIDPSAYGGHREVDLAMLRLFGAPSRAGLRAYEEVAPLADGWRERVELYQLLPLLVHALLFGGSYRRAAERVRRALRLRLTPDASGSRSCGLSRRARRGRNWEHAPDTLSRAAGACICSRVCWSPATTAAS